MRNSKELVDKQTNFCITDYTLISAFDKLQTRVEALNKVVVLILVFYVSNKLGKIVVIAAFSI